MDHQPVDYKRAFDEMCTRRRQALERLRHVIAMFTTIANGDEDHWLVIQCKEALSETRAAYDLIAEHMDPDNILDELADL